MLLKRFYDDKLAQASYMIGCQVTGEALVIDANRDTEQYIAVAEDEGMVIRYATETHIHADYLSGTRQLARRVGATLILSGDGGADWQYGFAREDRARIVRDGDELALGNVVVQVLHTPGHTPEHISFMITDGAASEEPLGVLTGDFIFVGDVGRPDLLEKAAGFENTMEDSARVLFNSLQRFRELPAYLQILPGHGAGSACGKALGAVPTSTLGYEHLVNWAFQCETEEDFVRQVLEDQPEPPAYFAQMKRMNREGPPILEGFPDVPRTDPTVLEGLLRGGGVVVDTRDRGRFAAGHVAGTVNIPLDDDFPGRCGWLVPYDRPISLVADGPEQARAAARDLALIGIDDIAGFFDDEALGAWSANHGGPETYRVVDWAGAEESMREEGATLVDVRGLAEWREGHAPGARHIHMGDVRERAGELPRDRPVLLYCGTGSRSAIGASLLQAEGFDDVRNVEGGIVERMRLELGIEES